MSRPSSVRVPVLSKQKLLIAPHRLMLRGLMQKMFCIRSRFCANTMPTVIAAGSAGGTTIVTRSNVRRIIRLASLPRSTYVQLNMNRRGHNWAFSTQVTWLAVIKVRSVTARVFAGMWRPLVSVITTVYYVARIICHHQVWYHTLSLHYACIRSSGIMLIP